MGGLVVVGGRSYTDNDLVLAEHRRTRRHLEMTGGSARHRLIVSHAPRMYGCETAVKTDAMRGRLSW